MINISPKIISRESLHSSLDRVISELEKKSPNGIISYFIHLSAGDAGAIGANNNLAGFLEIYQELIKLMFTHLLSDYRLGEEAIFPREKICILIDDMTALLAEVAAEKCPEIDTQDLMNAFFPEKK